MTNLFKRGRDNEVSGDTKSNGQRTKVIHLNARQFEELVSRGERPMLVDFWAEWCGPCHMIAPSVDRLASEYAGRAVVAKLNADEHPEILDRFGIMGIPTLIYFKEGEEVDRVVGAIAYGTLKDKLEGVLDSGSALGA
jgi:thioredoxin 1